jgi:hypothetical protein
VNLKGCPSDPNPVNRPIGHWCVFYERYLLEMQTYSLKVDLVNFVPSGHVREDDLVARFQPV